MKNKKLHCSKCKSEKNLAKYSKKIRNGIVYQYYMCTHCNTERHKRWYHQNPDNAIKVQILSMKSYAKRFGYKLVKIKDEKR